MDRESEGGSKLSFTVLAFDGGTPQLSGTTNVEVDVADINDNPPHFALSEYHVYSEEELPPPVIVHKIKVRLILPNTIIPSLTELIMKLERPFID